jgi:hypothetical protein
MTEQTEPRPIPVHVASYSDELRAMLGTSWPAARPSSASSPTTRTVYRTITLTAGDPAQEIMAASDDRISALILVIDADVFIGDNKSDVARGAGAYIPCTTPAATKPSLSAPVPIDDRRVIYAAPVVALIAPAVLRVAVIATYRD